MKIVFNFAGRINSRKLKKHPIYFCKSLSPTYVLFSIFALYDMHFRHYSLRIRISFKISFQCSLKLILIKKFHGSYSRVPWNNIWTIPVVPWNSMELKQQNLKFHGIPWNYVQIQSSMEFQGTFSILPSSMEFHGTFIFRKKVLWNSMKFLKFQWIPWKFINLIF